MSPFSTSELPSPSILPDASILQLPSDVPALQLPSRGDIIATTPTTAAAYPAASAATTMPQVRAAIDDLDRQIVALLGKRMRYINAAARIKSERAAVRDEWRVNDVIGKAKAQATKVDFPEELAGRLYAMLVEGSIQYEFQQWDEGRKGRKDCRAEE